jgi:resuscitation-promoting factor RpfB
VECDPNYSGCVPIAADVDCIGAGDGPVYIRMGAIVTGEDIYDLDSNGNGLACDPTERG